MNKYRVDGKQLILKLAQPKYRAPKQPRYQQPTSHETSGYYAQNQVSSGSLKIKRKEILTFRKENCECTVADSFSESSEHIDAASICDDYLCTNSSAGLYHYQGKCVMLR